MHFTEESQDKCTAAQYCAVNPIRSLRVEDWIVSPKFQEVLM
jgi:hypothetical protein